MSTHRLHSPRRSSAVHAFASGQGFALFASRMTLRDATFAPRMPFGTSTPASSDPPEIRQEPQASSPASRSYCMLISPQLAILTRLFSSTSAFRARGARELKPVFSISSARYCAFSCLTFPPNPCIFYRLRTSRVNYPGWGVPGLTQSARIAAVLVGQALLPVLFPRSRTSENWTGRSACPTGGARACSPLVTRLPRRSPPRRTKAGHWWLPITHAGAAGGPATSNWR